MVGTQVYSTHTAIVTVLDSALVARIAGGILHTVPATDDTVLVDGSLSFDPDDSDTSTLQYVLCSDFVDLVQSV